LANSEASKFRLAFHFFEGTKAWKKLGGNLGFAGGEIGSPTVSGGFWDKIREVLQKTFLVGVSGQTPPKLS
jgi:hypothetical protein